MLSAIDEEETIVGSISRYAEDYITKPFSPRELVARVQRVLRRIGDYSYTWDVVARVDPHLSIDFPHQRAIIDDQLVQLTPTETKLLYLLMRNAGRTVSTSFLLQRLWPVRCSRMHCACTSIACARRSSPLHRGPAMS